MPYFDPIELRQLLKSNYFSILYYKSETWHMPSFLKPKLLAASAAGLQLCTTGGAHNEQKSYTRQTHALLTLFTVV